MDKELKIFALEYVKLQDDLFKEEKLAIGKFIMEASDEQVAYMLFTGEVKDKLTKEDLSYLGEQDTSIQEGDVILYNPSWGQLGRMFTKGQTYERGVTTGVGGTLAAAALVAAVSAIAYKTYKNYFSKAAKACKGKEGLAKKNCIAKFKKDAQKAKLADMQKGISFCAKTKDPESCKHKLQGKINKEKAKMGAL